MSAGAFVSYLRVSTKQQRRSGLGLDAQRRAVAAFLAGGSWRHMTELVEVENGARDNLRLLARQRQTLALSCLNLNPA